MNLVVPIATIEKHLFAIVATITPIISVLQPFIPYPFDSIALYFRMLILPALLISIYFRAFDIVSLLIFLSYLCFQTMFMEVELGRIFLVISSSLIGMIVFFRIGRWMAGFPQIDGRWRTLIFSATALNVFTAAILLMASFGLIDQSHLLSILNKDEMFGLDRFSLGNPIEVPLLVNALLYAGLRNTEFRNSMYLFASLNLSVSAISGSRIVFLISLILFFECMKLSSISKKIAVAVIAFGLSLVLIDIWISYLSVMVIRFNGLDDGSASDRAMIYTLVANGITTSTLFFGGGLTYSYSFLQRSIGEYRSVESIFLELILDIGLFGIVLLLYVMFAELKISFLKFVKPKFSLINLLFLTQIMLFLPINTLTPLVMFCIGASIGSRGSQYAPVRRDRVER